MTKHNLIVGEIGEIISPEELFEGFWNSMPPELFNSFLLITELIKYVLIAFLIYIIISIILKLFLSDRKKLKKINKNVSEINNKLDSLIRKHDKKEKKSKK